MERQNEALLERVPSTELFTEPRRNSNTKAVKVAGLTVLACLLLAGQAFTAFYVIGQKDHLNSLEQGQENLKKELTRRFSAAPKMMHAPMSKMPLLVGMDEDTPKTEVKKQQPLTKLQSSLLTPKEGSGLVEGSRRMMLPMSKMPILTDFSEDKLSEEKVATTETPVVEVETKCKVEAGRVMPGFYQPQCDEEGNFKPMQCWHSTGFCWCVDKDGKEVPGTLKRERPECGNVN
ncbi:CD74 molecule, major histocompatibility complex, class II invariant chain a [Trichomycterus rosablanca]|uniref:CD74 molecule, major histocompatibility complex, class II invariant chain a n=1 Tax=Trichomycterus rosablanca TaxID=2290929 RepID=UPI002F357937